jgi:hypothetical protein
MNISKIDIYIEEGQSIRYVLGKDGINPLYVIALNPSVATREKFDQTVIKAFGLANIFGYDGCIIFNLIPSRESNSENLPVAYDQSNINRNTHEMIKQINKSKTNNIDILACWGEKVTEKAYLKNSLNLIHKELSKNNELKINWFCLKDTKSNKILTNKNHPRHLSFLQETTFFQNFDFDNYVKNIT